MHHRPVAIATLLLLSLAGATAAEEVSWLSDIDEAWEVAARDGRPLLVYVSAADCFHCARMDQQTLTDPQLAAEIAQDFIPVRVDAQDRAAFVKAYRVKAYPTLLVLAPNKTAIDSVKGYQTPSQVHKRLNAARRIITAEERKTVRR